MLWIWPRDISPRLTVLPNLASRFTILALETQLPFFNWSTPSKVYQVGLFRNIQSKSFYFLLNFWFSEMCLNFQFRRSNPIRIGRQASRWCSLVMVLANKGNIWTEMGSRTDDYRYVSWYVAISGKVLRRLYWFLAFKLGISWFSFQTDHFWVENLHLVAL